MAKKTSTKKATKATTKKTSTKATKKDEDKVAEVEIAAGEEATQKADEAAKEQEKEAAVEKEEVEQENAKADKEQAAATPPATEKKAEATDVESPALSFFKQYIENLASDKIALAAASINNCMKMMLRSKDEVVYNSVFGAFNTEKKFLAPDKRTIFKGLAALPLNDRAVVETVLTAFSMVVRKTHKNSPVKISIDHIRKVTKSDHFATWLNKVIKR